MTATHASHFVSPLFYFLGYYPGLTLVVQCIHVPTLPDFCLPDLFQQELVVDGLVD